jgi:tripartite-type tricarboxylate transporter receptor subunit TctC
VEYFDRVGGEPYPSTPEELGRFVLSETAKWAKIVQDAGIEKQ